MQAKYFMHPILFNISGIPISASAFFLVLAILIGFYVGRKETRRREITDKEFYIYWILSVPTALIMAAVNSALFHGRSINIIAHPGDLTSTGLISFGAVLGTLGLGVIMAKVYRRSPGQLLDAISIILPLILGVYRIGCILNGCCHGQETDGFLGFYLPNISGRWAHRYPTQILLLVFDFALFFFLWKWRLNDPPEGKTTLVFLLSFSIFRLLLDSLRELPMVNDWFNILQLGSITILLITVYVWVRIQLKKRSQNQ